MNNTSQHPTSDDSAIDIAAKQHLLVVDDDERLRQLLSRFLSENGFLVSTADSAAQARDILQHLSYDLLVLDVMMPGEDGLSLTRSLGADGISVPVLLLTALGEVDARIAGLEAGADDYLPKPFEPRELLLRINAILRRHASQPRKDSGIRDSNGHVQIGQWQFDPQRGELIGSDDARVLLTQVETTLLKALLSRHGSTINREELATLCGVDAAERTIDVQVTRLRRKLEADPKQPRHVQTVRGKGYVLWLE